MASGARTEKNQAVVMSLHVAFVEVTVAIVAERFWVIIDSVLCDNVRPFDKLFKHFKCQADMKILLASSLQTSSVPFRFMIPIYWDLVRSIDLQRHRVVVILYRFLALLYKSLHSAKVIQSVFQTGQHPGHIFYFVLLGSGLLIQSFHSGKVHRTAHRAGHRPGHPFT